MMQKLGIKKDKMNCKQRVDYQKRSLFSNDPDKLAQEMANVFIITWDRLRSIAEKLRAKNMMGLSLPIF